MSKPKYKPPSEITKWFWEWWLREEKKEAKEKWENRADGIYG